MFQTRLRKGLAVTAVLVAAVAGFEGVRTVAYKDPVGIPTICFGHTRGVKMGDKKTMDECKSLLYDELLVHEAGMQKCIRNHTKIPDLTYASFVSFTYNVGVGAFCRSTMAKKINRNDLRGACNELRKWVYAGGVKLRGLVKRREAEREMCLKGLK